MKALQLVFTFLLVFSTCVQTLDIFEAVRQDNAKGIKLAIDSGENIDKIGPGGQTPLMHAVLQGQTKAVETLLKLGASTSIGEKDGYTPMHAAGFQGRARIAQALINHGLDPSDQHSDGFMPIHRACWGSEKRHTDTVRTLLKNGVPHDQVAANGNTPLDAANQHGNKRTIELLKGWTSKSEL